MFHSFSQKPSLIRLLAAGFLVLGPLAAPGQADTLRLDFPAASDVVVLHSPFVASDFLGHDGYDPVATALVRGATPESMAAQFDCHSGMQARCSDVIRQAARAVPAQETVLLTDSLSAPFQPELHAGT